jgi:selenide,water dikinase
VLRLLPKFHHPDLLVGHETSDDAGVFRLRADLAIVNTVDFFTPIVDDPFVFGQIAAANALSDVYAMGGDPLTALNIVGFPNASLGLEVMTEILKGGSERARAAGVVVVGGHTIIDSELKYGMAITGAIHPKRILRNVGARAGDALVLTKPLGTGIVTTALKRRQATPRSVRAATASMVALNKAASQVARTFAVHACSDVTGFGLLGHASEMAMGSGVSIVLDSAALPVLPGAADLAERGFVTGGCSRNRAYLADKVMVERPVSRALEEVAFDPQTSGGLLIAVSARVADRLVRALHRAGVRAATIVGRAVAKRDLFVYLR